MDHVANVSIVEDKAMRAAKNSRILLSSTLIIASLLLPACSDSQTKSPAPQESEVKSVPLMEKEAEQKIQPKSQWSGAIRDVPWLRSGAPPMGYLTSSDEWRKVESAVSDLKGRGPVSK